MASTKDTPSPPTFGKQDWVVLQVLPEFQPQVVLRDVYEFWETSLCLPEKENELKRIDEAKKSAAKSMTGCRSTMEQLREKYKSQRLERFKPQTFADARFKFLKRKVLTLENELKSRTRGQPKKNRIKCPLCVKTFATNQHMLRHKDIHSGVSSNFKCDICDKCFVQECTLSRHKRTCHIEEKFRCYKCPATYARKDSLEKHLKKGKHHIQSHCIFCDQTIVSISLRAEHEHVIKPRCHPFGKTCKNVVNRRKITQNYAKCKKAKKGPMTWSGSCSCAAHESITCCQHHKSEDTCHPWGQTCAPHCDQVEDNCQDRNKCNTDFRFAEDEKYNKMVSSGFSRDWYT